MSKPTKAEARTTIARLKQLPAPDLTDPDNPEWTEADFARAPAAGRGKEPGQMDRGALREAADRALGSR